LLNQTIIFKSFFNKVKIENVRRSQAANFTHKKRPPEGVFLQNILKAMLSLS
jgi:Rod binding domain-containing protein